MRRRLLTFTLCLLAFAFSSWWLSQIGSMQEEMIKPDNTQSVPESFAVTVEKAKQQRSAELQVTEVKVDHESIKLIEELPWLETLILDQGVLTDQSMEHLVGLEKLRHLRLRKSPITDLGMEAISRINSLWYLNLPHSQCTEMGVAHLKKLPSLRQLRMGSEKLGNEVCLLYTSDAADE